MKLYKVTAEDGSAYHGGSGKWHLPTADGPGEWMPTIAHPVVCKRGYHLITAEHLPAWTGPALWEAEGRGGCDASDATKLCFAEARLVRRVEAWNERTLRLFACDCAERVVHLCKDDKRPAECIAVARRYAEGAATDEELDAALEAAEAAARAAAVYFAGNAAGAAALDSAWAAAWYAARYAAGATARAAETSWQRAHLREMLGLGVVA